MKILKTILFGLIFLVILTQIFNYPGSNPFHMSSISHFFPLSGKAYFYHETAWIISKIFVLLAYLITFPLILRFRNKFTVLDTALLYFGSFSILLTSVSLHYFEILSVPFLLISFLYTKKKNLPKSLIFLLVSALFSWHTLIFLPVVILYLRKSKKSYFLSLLCVLSILYLLNPLPNKDVFNLNWLISHTREKYLMFPYLSVISLVLSISAFIFVFLRFYRIKLAIKKLPFISFLTLNLATSIFYILFSFSFISLTNGFLIIPVLLTLLLHLEINSKSSLLALFSINIIVFANIFLRVGTAGIVPIQGEYFTFAIIFVAILTVFYYTKLLTNLLSKSQLISSKKIERFLIIFMLVFNLAILTANGSSDRVAWSDYAHAVAIHPDPFYAHSLSSIDQRYPPLSTVIMSAFANGWKTVIGIRDYGPNFVRSPDYAQSVKLSVFVFYLITIFILYKLSKKNGSLFVILTTFSLSIQTQGLGDVNIYLIPTLIGSIFFLTRKKIFLSGLLMGITLSIKWQPVILLPLFAAFILDKKELINSIPKAVKFALGFAIAPTLSWALVLIQPEGKDAFSHATEYLIQGAPMLSGQALNLNWIVTYFLHAFASTDKIESIWHLEGLNRQIYSSFAPTIFQGYLFLIAALIIVVHFFFRQKKNIYNLITGCFMIFFSHQILNKSAYEKHLFYSVFFILVYYLLRPTKQNRILLILFDLMTVMNLIFFYGFTGPKDVNRMFLGIDLTVIFSIYYVAIYFFIFYRYLKTSGRLSFG